MPLYEIHHSCTLSAPQRTALATHITTLHSSTFTTPTAFVNVAFHATPADTHLFVGAAPARTNYVLAHLRPRPNNAEKLAHIVRSISGAWEEHVRSEGGGTGAGRLDDERALHNVFLFEDIAAGAEQGFVLPLAGQEGAWAREHMSAFEARAGAGDEGMKVLVEQARKLV